MRITAEMAILALVTMPCHSEGRQGSKQSIRVYLDLRAEVRLEAMIHAQHVAAGMFEKAGLSLNWHWGRCEVCEEAITVEITSAAPRALHPGALAFSELNDSHIRVFFDRIEQAGAANLIPFLLGHVLVHEITHVLQGINHHSEEGVMKKRWSADDLYQMSYRPLPFDPVDVQMIRRGLASRDRAATSVRLGNRGVAEFAAVQ
jgi:hypothetical protein